MINKKFTYEELDKLWEKEFPNSEISFSIYDLDEETDKIIPTISFLDKTPIVEGQYKLTFNSWDEEGYSITKRGKTLTWKKLINTLDKYGDGHHIYLEEILVNGNHVEVFLGS